MTISIAKTNGKVVTHICSSLFTVKLHDVNNDVIATLFV